MEIKISNDNYNIISSGTVIMYKGDSELKFNVKASNTFSFELVLKFITDDNKERSLRKTVIDNRIIFECTNFKESLGVGTTEALSIATVSGKEIFFHFWSYSMGERNTRKIEYTFLEKE